MPKTPPDNLPVGPVGPKNKVLSITPSRKAIGAALVDGLGVDRTWLLRLAEISNQKDISRAVRQWLHKTLAEVQPKVIVLEKLSSRRKTGTNLMLSRLLRNEAIKMGFPDIRYLERKDAFRWLCEKRNSPKSRQIKATLRGAANLLLDECPEFRVHPAPTCTYRTDWDRTWGQIVAAAALALCTRKRNS